MNDGEVHLNPNNIFLIQDFVLRYVLWFGDTVNVVAWKKTMTVPETKRFNRKGRLDRQSKSLREYLEQVVNGKSKKETSNQTKGNKNK